jgi:serine/threonine protein kinase/Tol biopolymer transport system component
VPDSTAVRARQIRFGPFELDVRAGELRKHGIRLLLREQPLQILLMLLDHPGEIVVRGEIRDRLWPNETVVEFDHGINNAIRRLRDALGESAEKPRYIQTVARRGYRFLGEVEAVEAPSSEPTRPDAPAPSGPENGSDDLEGTRISHYLVLDKLGSGGMGIVFRAKDLNLKRNVALKFLPEEYSKHARPLERFQQEARAAAALNHPNICTVYEIGEHQSRSFIAMELLEGQTLKDLLAERPVQLEELLDFAIQITGGLGAAHRTGIVHRDLKPANLFIAKRGQAKILDFGLAKLLPERQLSTVHETGGQEVVIDSAAAGQQTAPSSPVGTVAYMSPEQVRGEDVDPRSDIFSLGVVLYEMAGGKRAFGGVSSAETMTAILRDNPQELPRSVPPALDRIVRRCLEKDPAQRFRNAGDLASALRSIPTRQAGSTPAPKRPSWLVWAAATVVACVAGAIGASWWGLHAHPRGLFAGTTLHRLTTDNGLTTDAALSADGKMVAYASDRANSGNLDIWMQQVEGGGAVRLTDNPADDYDPSISPDGSQVAFRSERDGGGIYVVPALGGDARLLIPKGRRPRFSPDGHALMYSIGNGDDYTGADLFVQRLSGGTPAQIGAGCGPFPLSAVWSPDSSRILFDGFCAESGYKESVWVSTPDGRRLAGLQLGEFVIDQWLANPSRLLVPFHVFSAGSSDEASVSVLPISEDGTKIAGPAERLTLGTDAQQHASAANGRLALSTVKREDHVWGIPIDASGHATGAARQLTSSSAGESLGYLSRDGRTLVFTSHRVDHHQLYAKDLKTGAEREIPWEGASVFYTALSPDATQLMFANYAFARRNSAGFIYEVPVGGGLPRKIWGVPDTFYGIWDWSPDGSTVLFFSRGVVEELDVKSGANARFLEDREYEVFQAHFSPDGRWVAFNAIKDSRSRLFVAPFRKGLAPRSEWIPVADSGWDDKPHYSYDGKLIFFSSDRDGFRCIWAQAMGPDMHPIGDPFAVYHSHERRRSLRNLRDPAFSIAAGPNMVVFSQEERTGNIWLMQPAKQDAH